MPNAHIVELFSPSGGSMTLFLALPSLQTSKGNSLSGALNIRGVKICDFDRIPDYVMLCCYVVIWEKVQDRPMVTTDH